MSDDLSEYGLKLFGEMMGADKARALQEGVRAKGFASGLGRMGINYCYAEVWGRDGLGRRERSLVTLAALIAQHSSHELANRVCIGVKNGLTVREFEEVLFQCLPYLGFSAVASATTVILQTLRELGLDTTSKTGEERGLL